MELLDCPLVHYGIEEDGILAYSPSVAILCSALSTRQEAILMQQKKNHVWQKELIDVFKKNSNKEKKEIQCVSFLILRA